MGNLKRPFDESNRLDGYKPVTPESSPKAPPSERGASSTPSVSMKQTARVDDDYASKYLTQPHESYPRKIYISREFHTRIEMIVNLLGKGEVKLTLSGFLHNILSEHFAQYGEEINRLLKENFDSKISFGKTKNEK